MITKQQVDNSLKREEDLAKQVAEEEKALMQLGPASDEKDAKSKIRKYQQLRDRHTFAKITTLMNAMLYIPEVLERPAGAGSTKSTAQKGAGGKPKGGANK